MVLGEDSEPVSIFRVNELGERDADGFWRCKDHLATPKNKPESGDSLSCESGS